MTTPVSNAAGIDREQLAAMRAAVAAQADRPAPITAPTLPAPVATPVAPRLAAPVVAPAPPAKWVNPVQPRKARGRRDPESIRFHPGTALYRRLHEQLAAEQAQDPNATMKGMLIRLIEAGIAAEAAQG